MLLADGESQNRETTVPNMLKYKQQHKGLPGTINTFGFGYNMDSRFFDQNAISRFSLLLLYSGRWLCGDVFCGHIQPTVGHHGKGGVPAIGKKKRAEHF